MSCSHSEVLAALSPPAFAHALDPELRDHAVDLFADGGFVSWRPAQFVEVLQTIRDTGTGLYIHTKAVDTTTPAGRAMFGMLGVFAEFEREMIVARVHAGLERARREGTVLGRPRVGGKVEDRVRAELAKGTGILKTAKLIGLGSGTVQRIKREMVAVFINLLAELGWKEGMLVIDRVATGNRLDQYVSVARCETRPACALALAVPRREASHAGLLRCSTASSAQPTARRHHGSRTVGSV
jgi:hypothetical protein